MKQLISFKTILLIVFILSVGIFFQACQKDEKASPKDNKLSVSERDINEHQNSKTPDATASAGSCGGTIPRATYKYLIKNEQDRNTAIYTARNLLRIELDGKCSGRGSCGAGKSCKSAITSEDNLQTTATDIGSDYTVEITTSAQCACLR